MYLLQIISHRLCLWSHSLDTIFSWTEVFDFSEGQLILSSLHCASLEVCISKAYSIPRIT